jgi:hypothetical protein
MKPETWLAFFIGVLAATALCVFVVPLIPFGGTWEDKWTSEAVGVWVAAIGTSAAFLATFAAVVTPMREAKASAKASVCLSCLHLVSALKRRAAMVAAKNDQGCDIEIELFREAIRVAKAVRLDILDPQDAAKFAHVIGFAIAVDVRLFDTADAGNLVDDMIRNIGDLPLRVGTLEYAGWYRNLLAIADEERKSGKWEGGQRG